MLVNEVVLSYYSQTSHTCVCNCICHVNHNPTSIIKDKVNVIWRNHHLAILQAWSSSRLSLMFRYNRKMWCVDTEHAKDLCIAHQYIDAWPFLYTNKWFGLYTPLLCGILRVDTIGHIIPPGVDAIFQMVHVSPFSWMWLKTSGDTCWKQGSLEWMRTHVWILFTRVCVWGHVCVSFHVVTFVWLHGKVFVEISYKFMFTFSFTFPFTFATTSKPWLPVSHRFQPPKMIGAGIWLQKKYGSVWFNPNSL